MIGTALSAVDEGQVLVCRDQTRDLRGGFLQGGGSCWLISILGGEFVG